MVIHFALLRHISKCRGRIKCAGFKQPPSIYSYSSILGRLARGGRAGRVNLCSRLRRERLVGVKTAEQASRNTRNIPIRSLERNAAEKKEGSGTIIPAQYIIRSQFRATKFRLGLWVLTRRRTLLVAEGLCYVATRQVVEISSVINHIIITIIYKSSPRLG
ncbi:hypothetical protein EVAR_39980_1 [Eumeta japonica]|uniref:Uncharacterized protein n=1 Tax=Eumeta variegata TaxID=151549 RepID=A0A4C1YJJ3_EUMVA|nr:hypothetical protein EVAR_39980_1 [Eumeta japonica]